MIRQRVLFQALLERLERLVFAPKLRVDESVGLVELGGLVLSDTIRADSIHQGEGFLGTVFVKQFVGTGKPFVEALAHGRRRRLAHVGNPIRLQGMPWRQVAEVVLRRRQRCKHRGVERNDRNQTGPVASAATLAPHSSNSKTMLVLAHRSTGVPSTTRGLNTQRRTARNALRTNTRPGAASVTLTSTTRPSVPIRTSNLT